MRKPFRDGRPAPRSRGPQWDVILAADVGGDHAERVLHTGVHSQHPSSFAHDAERYPRPWAQGRYRQIVRRGEPERGGHFPSPEAPEYFVEDLREGFAVVLTARR